MIVEVRTYRTKESRRGEFLEFFVKRAIPALQRRGMVVFGPLVDLENPNVFVWLRAFSSLEERERLRSAFYESDEWKNELEKIAMPMLDAYMFSLTATVPGFVSGVIGD